MTSDLIHPTALCESPTIGTGTRICAFARVLSQAQIGADCDLGDNVLVENDVVIGNRVVVNSGVQLWDGVRLDDDVFVGPNATFATERVHPGGKRRLSTHICAGASVGGNATILEGLTVGRGSIVAAGAVVTQDVPAFAVVAGNPAQIVSYAPTERVATAPVEQTWRRRARLPGGGEVLNLTLASDLRGSLMALEFAGEMPWTPARFFTVFGVPSRHVRGEHAHKECSQVLIALAGSVKVMLDDSRERTVIELAKPSEGLLIPPGVWASQFDHSAEAVLGVFASLPYDPLDYIRSYEEFLAYRRDSESDPGR